MTSPTYLRAFVVLAAALGFAAPARAEVSFSRDVRPILAQRCFKCHGLDDKQRKGKLRLDVRDAALRGGQSGESALVPGKPDASALVRRVHTDDPTEVMPPPSTKVILTEREKKVLRDWVAAGAEYESHWAFVPPRPIQPPAVQDTKWPKNPVDHFILARLEAEGLRPSPLADRATLIRRASLDLIGLPPTPEEIEAFLRDKDPRAYENLVDRLLASQHYGERWARKWLDLARYADTNGYEKDRPRSVWPWRDWVINALNADLPFDQFTLQQLAGDLLPNATLDQRVATGFHRNTMLNEEGGIDPLEFRFHALTDRVATTGTTWLGLTLGCAQCHTHKYDPVAQREYYQFLAFLNNADEPDLDLPRPELTARRRAILDQIARKTERLADQFPGGRGPLADKFAAWLARERARSVAWTTLRPTAATSNLPLLTPEGDGSVFVSGDTTKYDTYQLKYRGDLRGVAAVRLEALPDDRLPAHGPGMCYYEGPKGDFFLGEFQLSVKGNPVRVAGATESYAKNHFGRSPVSAKLAVDGDPQTGWSCAGRFGERHEAVFVLAEPLGDVNELDLKMTFGRHYACSLGRFRISVTADARAAARELPEEVQQLLRVPDARLTPDQRDRLRRYFLLATPELASARAEIDNLRQSLPKEPTALVFQERPAANPRPTFVHYRGEFLQPRERVEPDVPAALPPLPTGVPRNRLTLARWLVDPNHPLTARVTVNRQWQALFGQGLVRTTQDFGLQGELPSHPELLDWLAREFIARGWSLKRLHKLLVLSATYRQSSRVTPELLARDPDNRLLGRAPRVRLEAEVIRDAALRSAGLLSPKIGGPSVFPPQPPGVTTEGTYGRLDWQASQGEDRYRRGLYTFSKRTAPYAMFQTFDAPSGESCVARREVSNTPLQALTLLNDPVLVEAAQALGRSLAAQPGTVEERVRVAFRRVVTRPADPDEVAALAAFFRSQKRRFEAKELDAEAVAGPGEGAGVAAAERAAWAALARVLFNLDEAITKG